LELEAIINNLCVAVILICFSAHMLFLLAAI